MSKDVLVELHLFSCAVTVFWVEWSFLLSPFRGAVAFDHLQLGRKNVFGDDAAALTLCPRDDRQLKLISLYAFCLRLSLQETYSQHALTLRPVFVSCFLTQKYPFLRDRLMFLQQRRFNAFVRVFLILRSDCWFLVFRFSDGTGLGLDIYNRMTFGVE